MAWAAAWAVEWAVEWAAAAWAAAWVVEWAAAAWAAECFSFMERARDACATAPIARCSWLDVPWFNCSNTFRVLETATDVPRIGTSTPHTWRFIPTIPREFRHWNARRASRQSPLYLLTVRIGFFGSASTRPATQLGTVNHPGRLPHVAERFGQLLGGKAGSRTCLPQVFDISNVW